jgi:hypothetical protein
METLVRRFQSHMVNKSDTFEPDFQRTLATNYDPNRDHTKLARQQTRDIKEWFTDFSPHIAIDMHEYGAATRYSGNYSNAADGMYSAAKVSSSCLITLTPLYGI